MKQSVVYVKKLKCLFVVLAVTHVIDVQCGYYDYVKSSLPYYGAALAVVFANYQRRNYFHHLGSYDTLSYALPAVAAGAQALLSQSGNWRNALVQSLPYMVLGLGALGVEKIRAQNQAPSLKKSSVITARTFLNQKENFYKFYKQYMEKETVVEDIISNLLKRGDDQIADNLVTNYSQLWRIHEQLTTTFVSLQSLAEQILSDKDRPQGDLESITGQLKTVSEFMNKISDPALVAARSFYANAIINKYYMKLKQQVITVQFVHKLMRDVMDIHQFFGVYGITLTYGTSIIQEKVIEDVTKQLDRFKQFDQEIDQVVNRFFTIFHQLNYYLNNNEVDNFGSNFAKIKKDYSQLKKVYSKYEKAIKDMVLRVDHMVKEHPEQVYINIYNDITLVAQMPWQGYMIALLQNHYITRKKGKDKYPTYFDVLNQAYTDQYFSQAQYNELHAFVENKVLGDQALGNRIVYWWKLLATQDQEQEDAAKQVARAQQQKPTGRSRHKKT